MNIGLYFGTFNPIHIGHLIIANHIAEHTSLDEIWLVVTPHNPHKKKANLLDDYQRLHLVHLATEDYPQLKPSDIEFKLPQPNYTCDTLAYLQEKYPQHVFSLIMGEDNLQSFQKWKNYETIINNHQLYVYPRWNVGVIDAQLANHQNVQKINAPIISLSATFIRENIKGNKNTKPLLPLKVWEFITHNLLYKNQSK